MKIEISKNEKWQINKAIEALQTEINKEVLDSQILNDLLNDLVQNFVKFYPQINIRKNNK